MTGYKGVPTASLTDGRTNPDTSKHYGGGTVYMNTDNFYLYFYETNLNTTWLADCTGFQLRPLYSDGTLKTGEAWAVPQPIINQSADTRIRALPMTYGDYQDAYDWVHAGNGNKIEVTFWYDV